MTSYDFLYKCNVKWCGRQRRKILFFPPFQYKSKYIVATEKRRSQRSGAVENRNWTIYLYANHFQFDSIRFACCCCCCLSWLCIAHCYPWFVKENVFIKINCVSVLHEHKSIERIQDLLHICWLSLLIEYMNQIPTWYSVDVFQLNVQRTRTHEQCSVRKRAATIFFFFIILFSILIGLFMVDHNQ